MSQFNNTRNKTQDWTDIDYDVPVQQDGIDVHTNELFRIREDWLSKLTLASHLTSLDDLWSKRLHSFTQFLLQNQSDYSDHNINLKGAWCLPEDPHMPSDARVEFLYMPTYIATAWLVLVKQQYPSISAQYSNYEQQLKSALDFASGRNLSGHGYDGTQELIVAVDYLSLGGVFKYVKENPFVSPKFSRAIIEAKKNIKHRLKNNKGWGSIGEDKGAKALRLLDGKL